jgi:transposase InsO family protein
MPWRATGVSEQRIQFVIRAQSRREALAQLCREFGISRPRGYLWLRRYEKARTLTAVQEKSRRPHGSPRRTAASAEQQVVALRKETGWGAKKLRILLREQAALQLPVRTIHRILARHEMIVKVAPGAAPGRFARSEPNELWQMDSKAKYTVEDGECHPLAIIDDHSRYLLGLHALTALTIEQAYPCLVETFRCYGLPQAMLMDHGALWWSPTNGWGLTWLSIRLIEQRIALLYGRVAHPQTQGKVERLNGTVGAELRYHGLPRYLREWPAALAQVRQTYNHRRPHEALEMQRPAERYRASARRYQEQTREWEYAQGSDVRRLDANGMLSEAGRRWFVCEALAGKRVCVERFDNKLVVSYRDMYIREIDPRGEKTRPLVAARTAVAESATVALRAPSADSATAPSTMEPNSYV